MSAVPPIEWGEEERATGAVSFTQHLKELSAAHLSVPATVEKINHAVETVVPRLVEAIQEELLTTTTTTTVVSTAITTTTPSTVAEKIHQVVATVVPNLVDAIQHGLSPTTTQTLSTTTNTPTSAAPPPFCGNPSVPQVSIFCKYE
jgi:hypothetical protein